MGSEINRVEIVDQKINKVMYQKSGATNKITRLNIPITWIRDYLGITEENRDVELILTSNNEIIIRKPIKETE